MNLSDQANFFYLNRDNRWPDFHLHNVEINREGELQLRAVPRAMSAMPQTLTSIPASMLPAGIAAAPDGTIFLSDPTTHVIWRIDPCCAAEPTSPTPPCVGAEGAPHTLLREPRGLFIPENRGALFVADSGNDRIVIIDLVSLRISEIWNGDESPDGKKNNSLHRPIALTGDAQGNVYVLCQQGSLLQKFNCWGKRQPEFWQTVEQSGQIKNPISLSIATVQDQEQVFVLERGSYPEEGARVVQFDTSGDLVKSVSLPKVLVPIALVATSDAMYIGDNGAQAVWKYDLDGSLVGAAIGFSGPVAALAFDGKTDLLVHTGDPKHPMRLAIDAGYLTSSDFWVGPLEVAGREVLWHRLKAFAKPLPSQTHVQFYVATDKPEPGENPIDLPQPNDSPDEIHSKLFLPPHEQPLDVLDLLLREGKVLHLYVGARITGEGLSTPCLSQIRISYDHRSYLPHLPAIYQRDEAAEPFLFSALSLFESFFEEGETKIRDLPALFDPYAAPREFLPWLAGWLALEIDENWSEELTRRTIAEAFTTFAWRGTAQGLRKSLERYAGIRVHVIEPILHFHIWSLGTTSTLGCDTMLASEHPQGAVLGTTATLDHSHLIAGDQYGRQLFEEVAHQFSVLVYARDANTPDKVESIRRIIEREKPAHTDYHLCIVQPMMRVGLQSRVGIDAVVAGLPPAFRLNEPQPPRSSLAGPPPGRLGEESKIGVTTRLD